MHVCNADSVDFTNPLIDISQMHSFETPISFQITFRSMKHSLKILKIDRIVNNRES